MGAHNPGPRSVYEFYDADGTCLYIGCTEDFARRLRYHKRERPWFGQIARMVVTVWPDAKAGLEVEALLIRTQNPVHNKALTDHDTPRRIPCRRCRRGTHAECLGTNRDGNVCRCGVCASARAVA